jgi:serpin B
LNLWHSFEDIIENLQIFFSLFHLGSEAAAATAVIMSRCCASISPKSAPIEFKADRPFLFFIRENHQNIVLFNGRFVSPPTTS